MVAYFEDFAASNLRVGLALACLVAAGYFNVVAGPLFFDDFDFIVRNHHVTGLEVGEIYRSSVSAGAGFPSNTYRPNQQLIFALLYNLFGETPHPYHLTSILVHLGNSFLVFALLAKLVIARPAAFVAAIVFAVHPVQSQAVSYVSGLAGPLALCFLLSGLDRWVASLLTEDVRKRSLWLAAALLLLMGAFFSKGDMVILAPLSLVVAIYLVLIGRLAVSRYLVLSLVCFWAMAFGYLFLKVTVLSFTGSIGMVEGSDLYTENLHVRISTFISVLHNYVEMILWPSVLSYTKPDVRYVTPFAMQGLIGLLIVGMGLLAARHAADRPRVFLGVGWFFAALAPFSGVIPLTSIWLEHWLYVPMIGVGILVAAGYGEAGPKLRQGLILLLIPLVLLALTRTVLRNREWSDAERFYLAEIEAAGVTVRMLNNLAGVYKDRGQIDEAIESLTRSIAHHDVVPEPHDNLAKIYFYRGELTKAEAEYRRALEISPTFESALVGLRDVHDRRGETNKATEFDRQLRTLRRGSGR